MSHVQKFIDREPNWLSHLETAFKIHVARDGDLVSLKYNQIESPMHEPIVQECRGMVVDTKTNKVVAHPYNKFWNHGEHLADPINWASARVLEKLDGSLMLLYMNPATGAWTVASSGTPTASGSFGEATISFADAFWTHWNALGMRFPSFPSVTFMFELCDQPNRIVVKHDKPRIVLHGARDTRTGYELSLEELAPIAAAFNWELVKSYPIASIEDCLAAAEALDPLHTEGFVVVDADFHRVKIKSPRYVILHHMKENMTQRRAIELWQSGEAAELLSYFPEFEPQVTPVHAALDKFATYVVEDLVKHASTSSRKDFAAAVKTRPWASALFKMYGEIAPSVSQAKEVLRAQSLTSLERLMEHA